jgi:hypothetical protein
MCEKLVRKDQNINLMMEELSIYFYEVEKIYKKTSKYLFTNNRVQCLFWSSKINIARNDKIHKDLLKKRIFALLFTLNIKLNIVTAILKENRECIPRDVEIIYTKKLTNWKLWVDEKNKYISMESFASSRQGRTYRFCCIQRLNFRGKPSRDPLNFEKA